MPLLKSKPATNVPRHVDDDPDVQRETEKLHEITQKYREAKARLDAANLAAAQGTPTPPPTSRLRSLTDSILGRAQLPKPDLTEQTREVEAYARAADEQGRTREATRDAVSRRIQDAELAEYKRITAATAAAIEQVVACLKGERSFIDGLERRGSGFGGRMRPVQDQRFPIDELQTWANELARNAVSK